MAAPYWAGDGIELYLGDCRAITEWVPADVLVTDPPYGRGWRQGRLHRPGITSDAHPGITGDGDTAVRDDALTLWGDRPAVVFGDLMLPPPAGNVQTLIYRKPPNAGTRGAMGGYRRDVEAIYLLGPWATGLGGRSSLLATSSRSQGNPSSVQGRHRHPHAKPDDVMQTLIAACPPGIIADPFAGSGSTLVAAKLQGRKAIGVELVEKYCETAARRLDQGVLTFPGKG